MGRVVGIKTVMGGSKDKGSMLHLRNLYVLVRIKKFGLYKGEGHVR